MFIIQLDFYKYDKFIQKKVLQFTLETPFGEVKSNTNLKFKREMMKRPTAIVNVSKQDTSLTLSNSTNKENLHPLQAHYQ